MVACIRLATAVTEIDLGPSGVVLTTTAGPLRARAVVLTVSTAMLTGEAPATSHVRVGAAHTFFSPQWGYLLRADFTRDEIAAPSVNRIVCWENGQLIATKLSVMALDSAGAPPPMAVPGAHHP